MKRIITIAAMITMILALNLPADAQHRGRGLNGKNGKHRSAENFETLRKMKLIETLELTEEQADKFLPIFTSHRKKMREIRKERMTILDSLSNFVKQEDAKEDIERMFELLNHNEKKAGEEKIMLANEISNILDIYQMGRLVLFKEHFERDLLETLFDRKRGGTLPPNEDDGI
jgi:Spy/CpxP family protein refolding chaperone